MHSSDVSLEDDLGASGPEDEDAELVREHRLGEDCIGLAEQIEHDVGLFDNSELGSSGRENMAHKMSEHAARLVGKADDTFKHSFTQKLESIHSAGTPFGALDACAYM